MVDPWFHRSRITLWQSCGKVAKLVVIPELLYQTLPMFMIVSQKVTLKFLWLKTGENWFTLKYMFNKYFAPFLFLLKINLSFHFLSQLYIVTWIPQSELFSDMPLFSSIAKMSHQTKQWIVTINGTKCVL